MKGALSSATLKHTTRAVSRSLTNVANSFHTDASNNSEQAQSSQEYNMIPPESPFASYLFTQQMLHNNQMPQQQDHVNNQDIFNFPEIASGDISPHPSTSTGTLPNGTLVSFEDLRSFEVLKEMHESSKKDVHTENTLIMKVRATNQEQLENFTQFLQRTAHTLKMPSSGKIVLPCSTKETACGFGCFDLHCRAIHFSHACPSTTDTFLAFVQGRKPTDIKLELERGFHADHL